MTHSALTLAQRLHGLSGFNEASHFACTAVSPVLSFFPRGQPFAVCMPYMLFCIVWEGIWTVSVSDLIQS